MNTMNAGSAALLVTCGLAVVLGIADCIVVVEPENSSYFRDVVLPGCEDFTLGLWPSKNVFYSPNYPGNYFNNTKCIRVLEAPPGYIVQLDFREQFNIEKDYLCSYDYLEVRDGPYGYSQLIDRYCGKKYPPLIRSTSRFLWLRFTSDESIERSGFKAEYQFILDDKEITSEDGDTKTNQTRYLFKINPAEWDGIVSVPEDLPLEIRNILNGTALMDSEFDLTWDILAPKGYVVRLFFTKFILDTGGDCKNNFVEVYDGTTDKDHLLQRICKSVRVPKLNSTRNRLFLRARAVNKYYLGLFDVLYTFITKGPCVKGQFDCGDNTCINDTLVCNGRRDCDLVYDESKCIKKLPDKATAVQKVNINYVILGSVGGVLGTIVFISCVVTLQYKCKQWQAPQQETEVVEVRENVRRLNNTELKHLLNGHANATREQLAGSSADGNLTSRSDTSRMSPRSLRDTKHGIPHGGLRTRGIADSWERVPLKARSQEVVNTEHGGNVEFLLPPPDPFKSVGNSNSDSSLYLPASNTDEYIPVKVTIEQQTKNPEIKDSCENFSSETPYIGFTANERQLHVRFRDEEKPSDVFRRIASERHHRPRVESDTKIRPSSVGSQSPRPDVVQEEAMVLKDHDTPETAPLLQKNVHIMLQKNSAKTNTPEILAALPRGQVYHLSV